MADGLESTAGFFMHHFVSGSIVQRMQCAMYVAGVLMVHLVYIKPSGVPDKLCVFPADEN